MKTDSNRKFALISLFVVLLFGVILYGVRWLPALADIGNHDFDELIQTNQPRLINDQATQTAEQAGLENDPEDQESTSKTPAPDPATVLQAMLQDFENNTFSQTGWLHYVYYHESEVDNGVALPKNYTADAWYLVDGAGYVSQDIGTFHDDAGNWINQGIFKDNIFINLITDERMEIEGPYKLKLDGGIIKSMLETQMVGSILTQENVTVDGKPLIRFSVLGNHENPIHLGNSSQPVKSVRLTILFDQGTGAISETEFVSILIDGTEELFYRTQIMVLEREDPPQELAQYLEDFDTEEPYTPNLEITRDSLVGSQYSITICFDLPSNRNDWIMGRLAGDVYLSDGTHTVPLTNFSLESLDTKSGSTGRTRCDRSETEIPDGFNFGQATLTVERIAATIPNDVDWDPVIESVEEIAPDLVWYPLDDQPGPGFGMEEPPPGMTAMEAHDLILGLIEPVVIGPWSIPVDTIVQ